MKTFLNPWAFAEHLLNLAAAEAAIIESGLEVCAKLIEKSAKDQIGHLQPEIGPYEAWEPLAESTIKDKARKGYLFFDDGNPLYRTGDLKKSIKHEVNALEAIIGSTSPVMVYQEYGTDKIPPRSVIGAAAYKNKEKIIEILTLYLASGFTGGSLLLPFLGASMAMEL